MALPRGAVIAVEETSIRINSVEVCVASQSIPSWNRIISWLKEMESLRKLLPEVSGLADGCGKMSPNRP